MAINLLTSLRRRANVEHEQLKSLINSMADGVIAIDPHMKIVISNGAAQNILDSNTSLPGKDLTDIFRPQDKNNQPIDATELVRGVHTSTVRRDLSLKYADGSVIDLYVSIAPVRLGYGQSGTHGFVLLLRDITREKSLEEERDEFISVVSHELRTPIAIAEGNISNAQFMIEKSGDTAQIKTALAQAHDQVIFLASMVNDLATLSRAERGKLEVAIEPIDAAALIQNLAKDYHDDATAKSLTITADVPAEHLEPLQSSSLYVREILQNFITNAIKYTDAGGVTISVQPASKGVMFAVKDTGFGISKSDQEKIFDKFFRSEDFRTRKTSGTGLGLYVTMKLAALLHADISVESQLDHGSTFSIFIPNLR